ncbi:MAG: hypothetical protein ACXVCY_09630 [Pseudobdellovibrionaceae bacterium]
MKKIILVLMMSYIGLNAYAEKERVEVKSANGFLEYRRDVLQVSTCNLITPSVSGIDGLNMPYPDEKIACSTVLYKSYLKRESDGKIINQDVSEEFCSSSIILEYKWFHTVDPVPVSRAIAQCEQKIQGKLMSCRAHSGNICLPFDRDKPNNLDENLENL